MRIIPVCLLFALLVLLPTTIPGCSKKSEPGGTANANFNVSGPAIPTTVPRGQSESVTLTLKPSKNFKGMVKLDAKSTDKAVKPALEQKEIKLDGTSKDVKLTVTADKTATPGKSTVRITATPEKGDPATLEVSFDVTEAGDNVSNGANANENRNDKTAATFDMTGPRSSTSVNQGERTNVALTLKPSKNFHEKVSLDAKALDAGLKISLDDRQVRLDGENKEVKLNVEAERNAKPGSHTVRVTATPAQGEPKGFDLSFTVKEKK